MSTYLPPAPGPAPRPVRRPLSARRALLVTVVLVFVPPVGIVLLWWRRGRATPGRIVGTVLAGLWSLIWLVALVTGPSQPATPAPVRFANVVATASPSSSPATTAASSAPTTTSPSSAAAVVATTSAAPVAPTTPAEVVTTVPAAAPASQAAPVAAPPTPVAAPPAAAPVQPGPARTIHPGAFCSGSDAGDTGFSSSGGKYVCALDDNGRYRWRAA